MASAGNPGRITGSLLLLHLAAGLMLPYILMQPAFAAPGYLENAAANAGRIRAAMLLLFMGGAVTIAAALLSMLSLSREFAARGGADASLLREVGAAVGSARTWAHFTHLLVVGSWIFTLFCALWRFRLVPRLLAGLGVLATVLQVTGVPLRALLGLEIVAPMAMPLAPVYVTVAVYLMVKGFRPRPGRTVSTGRSPT